MKLRQGKARSSEEENKQSVHAKESETLTVNLSSEPLRKSSVVLNHENLRLLAILHESLVSLHSVHHRSLIPRLLLAWERG